MAEQSNIMKRKWNIMTISFMIVVSFIITYIETWRVPSDIGAHMVVAQSFHSILANAHPGWHIVTWLCNVLLPLSSIHVAAALSTTLFQGLMGGVVWKLAERYLSDYKYSSLVTVCAMLVGPLYLRFFNANYYLGQGTPNVWHNPTTLAVRPIGLIIILLTLCYWDKVWKEKKEEEKSVYAGTQILLGLLLAFSVLIKPSFVMIYLPSCAVILLVRLCKKGVRYFPNLIVQHLFLFVPAVLVLLQYLKIYIFGSSTSSSESGVVIALFRSMSLNTPNVLISQVFRVAFPLFVIVLWYKQFFKDKLAKFALLMYAFGFAEAALLQETGERATHGNFGWGSQLASSYLWIVAVCIWVREFRKDRKVSFQGDKKLKAKYAISACILCWHAVAGICYYILIVVDKSRFF